jgi:hypothetical protein
VGLFSRPFMDKRGDEGERGRKGGVSAGSKPSQWGKEGDTVLYAASMIPKDGGGGSAHKIPHHSTAHHCKLQ